MRDALYRGADWVILLSDRKFAGADTLATSYALKCAVERMGAYDLVFCGRQAIDGDTAQVGPQMAEKLGIPQITYAQMSSRCKTGRSPSQGHAPGPGDSQVYAALSADRRGHGQSAPSPLGAQDDRRQAGRHPPRIPSLAEAVARVRDRGGAGRAATWPTRDGQDPCLDGGRHRRGREHLGLAGSPTKVLKVDYVVLGTSGSVEVSLMPGHLQPDP